MYAICDCGESHVIKLDGYRDAINGFLKDVHSGNITADSIQPEYYNSLAKKLTAGVADGLGGTSFEASDYRNTLKAFFDHNIYAFSGAKSLVMLQEYNRLLLDDNDEVVPFSEFKKRATQIDTLYNKTYLDAEYTNAIASAQMADKWQSLQAHDMLEYRTVGDDRVRLAHAALDSLILRSTDPLWNKIYPPNGWHCRCTVIPAADSDTPTDLDNAKGLAKAADIQPYFKTNVGKEKVIFRDGHPYFKFISKLKELDAIKNYGLSSVEKIYNTADLPNYEAMPDKTSALIWWNEKAGDKKGSFDVTAKDGISVFFDKDFKNHVLEDNSDNRYRFLNQAESILKKPDEIWSNRIKGNIQQVYIKYYDKYPIVVAVNADDQVHAVTMYEVQKNGKLNFEAIKNLRKGVLKYKK